MPLVRHIILDLTIVAFLFTATGCLISTSNSVKESGTAVNSGTLQQVEVGKTTESWLLATLGTPTARCKVPSEPGVEILSYNHEVVKTSHGHVFLLFSGSDRKVDSHRTIFEVTDGVVTKYWTES
jgi:hypothetical protein